MKTPAVLDRLRARFDELTAPPTAAVAVELAAGRVVAARLGPGGELRAGLRRLGPEALAPSAVRANLGDAAAVAAAIRALLAALEAEGQAVTLLLPDLTARLSVLEFEALPGRREELEALARLRLRKSLPFAEEQAAISCQVVSPTRLLVALADRARLDEYEDCLEAAGARAATVLPSGLACLAAQPLLDHGALLLRYEPGCLTTAFCWQGKVEFFRAVEVRGEVTFEDVFPSVAFFRDRIEQASPPAAEPAWLLYAAGLGAELMERLREEAPWASLRTAELAATAVGGEAAGPAQLLAVAGALRGRFA
ncbi:MAG TPA: hypothetical protein VMV31_07660 [Terriglobales bacterium]|nr:hypothetical protein [Terriglobales bacterium]